MPSDPSTQCPTAVEFVSHVLLACTGMSLREHKQEEGALLPFSCASLIEKDHVALAGRFVLGVHQHAVPAGQYNRLVIGVRKRTRLHFAASNANPSLLLAAVPVPTFDSHPL